MSSQALCSSKITTGAHSLVGRGFLPWAEFSCFVGLDAVVRFSHGDPGPRCSVGAHTCGLRRAAQAPIAWPCRTSAPDMVGRGIGPRDNLGSQGPLLPGHMGPFSSRAASRRELRRARWRKGVWPKQKSRSGPGIRSSGMRCRAIRVYIQKPMSSQGKLELNIYSTSTSTS